MSTGQTGTDDRTQRRVPGSSWAHITNEVPQPRPPTDSHRSTQANKPALRLACRSGCGCYHSTTSDRRCQDKHGEVISCTGGSQHGGNKQPTAMFVPPSSSTAAGCETRNLSRCTENTDGHGSSFTGFSSAVQSESGYSWKDEDKEAISERRWNVREDFILSPSITAQT